MSAASRHDGRDGPKARRPRQNRRSGSLPVRSEDVGRSPTGNCPRRTARRPGPVPQPSPSLSRRRRPCSRPSLPVSASGSGLDSAPGLRSPGWLCKQASGRFPETSTTSTRPSLSRSPVASPRARRGSCQGGPARSGDVDELTRSIAEKELCSHRVRRCGPIVADMTVGLGQVKVSVVVGVEQQPVRIRARTGSARPARPRPSDR